MSRESVREEWRSRLELYAGSGLSQREWCAQNNLPLRQFVYWRRQLRQKGEKSAGATTWCPLNVLRNDAGITIRVGVAAIEVSFGFDAGLLRAVVRALGDAPC